MKNIVPLLILFLPLSIYTSEYIDLENAPSQTIKIKNDSHLKAMIYYINDEGRRSWVNLRPTRKCALFTRGNSSTTITFLIDGEIFIFFPKINTELRPTIPANHTKFVINP